MIFFKSSAGFSGDGIDGGEAELYFNAMEIEELLKMVREKFPGLLLKSIAEYKDFYLLNLLTLDGTVPFLGRVPVFLKKSGKLYALNPEREAEMLKGESTLVWNDPSVIPQG